MRARLRDFTPAQIKKLSNGCGSKSSFVPVPEFIFHASCDKHDVLYIIGGTEEDRKKADKIFYKYMMLDIVNEDSRFKRIYYSIWAYTYYKAVRVFGKKYFNYGKQKTMKELI